MQSSRGWIDHPGEDEWRNFQRGAGVAPDLVRALDTAVAESTPWTADPVARVSSPDALMDRSVLLERVALFAGSLALMLATAVVARDYSVIVGREDQMKMELVQHEQAAGANREARDRALAARQQVEALTDALARPNVLELQEHLLSHLPQAGTAIQDLSYDGTQLRVVLKVPSNLAREAIVRELERGGMLGDVREARDSPAGTLALVMNLRQPGIWAGAAAPALTPQAPLPAAP